jgi:hypothetical protein
MRISSSNYLLENPGVIPERGVSLFSPETRCIWVLENRPIRIMVSWDEEDVGRLYAENFRAIQNYPRCERKLIRLTLVASVAWDY